MESRKRFKGIKENTKKGHDFAARVFVIKKTGATPLSNRAINYVFSSNSEIGFNLPAHIQKNQLIMFWQALKKFK